MWRLYFGRLKIEVTATMPPRKRRAFTDVARYIAHLHIHCLCCSPVASSTSWVCGFCSICDVAVGGPLAIWSIVTLPYWRSNADLDSWLSSGLPRRHRLGWLIALTTFSAAAMPPYRHTTKMVVQWWCPASVTPPFGELLGFPSSSWKFYAFMNGDFVLHLYPV
jgi:hypothetical protein